MEAPREVTPPPLQPPTAKEKKYDRQLRLWAASGQRALEESHVLVVVGEEEGSNSSATASETLKNLVLPGIGNFSIADAASVSQPDLGVNFFLEADSLGKSRAEETKKLLEELNPDVTGNSISRRFEDWLPEIDSLKLYNLVILCGPIAATLLQRICKYGEKNSIPVISVQCSGFYATFSIQLPSEFPIVDTHPDPDSVQDVRLLAPWPELAATVESLGDISALEDHEHGHIPYLLLLLHYLEQWKASHNNKFPDTFREKTQFRELVRAGARTSNAEGGEENYDEACAAVLKTINPPTIGSGCRDMFQMSSCTDLTTDSSNFWIVANAIRTFSQTHGVLPLPGSLPDMKAKSADYIKLQNLYKSKARKDVAEVSKTVRELESQLFPKSSTHPKIPDAEIEAFCRNASSVKVLRGSPLPQLRPETIPIQTFLPESGPEEAEEEEDEEESTSLLPIYLHMTQHPAVSSISSTTNSPRHGKVAAEVSRSTGAELHNIASLTGGMVAQESIKLLTRQYVPVDNTCVFDGITSRCEVFRL